MPHRNKRIAKKAQLTPTTFQENIHSIMRLAAHLCNASQSAILFSEKGYEWVNSFTGLKEVKNNTFSLLPEKDLTLEVAGPLPDNNFFEQSRPADPSPGFYAAMPLIAATGDLLGHLTVQDPKPNLLDDSQKEALQMLASQLVAFLQVVQNNHVLNGEFLKQQKYVATQKKYQKLFEQARDLDFILNTDGSIRYVSSTIKEILGFSAKDFTGKSIRDLFLSEDKDMINEHISQISNTGIKRREFEARILNSQNKVRWIQWLIACEGDYWLLSGRDITSQKQIELDYGQLWVAKNLEQGVSISDETGKIIWINDAYTRLTGYTLAEISQKSAGDLLIEPQTCTGTLEHVRQRSGINKPLSGELLVYRKSGAPFWTHVISSVAEADGRKRVIQVMADITDKKKSDLELETLALAVRKSSGGVSIQDRDGRILWMNEALEQMLGFDYDELAKMHPDALFTSLVSEKTSPKNLATVKKALQNHKPYQGELEIKRKDNRPLSALITSTPIFDKSGRLERTVTLVVDITSRKHTESEVRSLSRAISQSSNVIIFRNLDGKITWVNNSFEKLFGFNAAAAIGTCNYDLLSGPETNLIQLNKAIGKIRSGKGGNFELTLYHRNGMPVSVISSLNPVIGEDGKIEGFTSIITDITERKKAEKEIKKLSLVADKSPNGILIRDPHGKVLWVNEAFEITSGYQADELIGHDISELFVGHGTDRKAHQRAVTMRSRGRNVNIELLLYNKAGAPVWINLLTYPILDDQGKVENMVSITTDITDLKKKNEELQMLSLVASKTVTGVIINDRHGRAFWMNDAFQKMSGYMADELKGKRIGDILKGPDTDWKELKKSRQIARSKRPYYTELLSYKKDGTPFWIAVSSTPVLNEKGHLTQEIEIIDDITDQKKAEFGLIKAKEEALQLSKAKETFLSVMSHEIRTPLNSIMGIAQLLLDEKPNTSQLKFLNLLKFSGENLGTLINDILDLTKIETGNLSLERADVNITELISQTMSSLQVKAAENRTRLTLDLDPKIPLEIKADSVRLYQILMNLVGNSIKFTKGGKVSLKLKLLSETDFKVKICFTIKDTGIGIPEDKLEHIFEPYTQASADTTRKFGGTGLGLTIVKNLLTLHGSQIDVKSKVGKGSAFSFTIEFEKTIKEKVIPEQVWPSSILIVDDENINRRVAGMVLGSRIPDIQYAENGEIAVEKVKNNQYGCVLMDLNMPVMNGIDATKIIRNLDNPYFRNLPIIALTGSTDEKDMEAMESCGMNGHVVKPFSKAALLNKIVELTNPEKEQRN